MRPSLAGQGQSRTLYPLSPHFKRIIPDGKVRTKSSDQKKPLFYSLAPRLQNQQQPKNQLIARQQMPPENLDV
jgi:hypothetical protein